MAEEEEDERVVNDDAAGRRIWRSACLLLFCMVCFMKSAKVVAVAGWRCCFRDAAEGCFGKRIQNNLNPENNEKEERSVLLFSFRRSDRVGVTPRFQKVTF